MSQISGRAAAARENARQADGKFGSFTLEDAGTDADLSTPMLTGDGYDFGPALRANLERDAAHSPRGIRVEGRMQIVGHVQGGLAAKHLGDTAQLVTEGGVYRGHTERRRGAYVLVDDQTGEEHPFYDADNNNNLTPHGVLELQYLERDTDPLPADRDEMATACLGPNASNEDKREFERSMRRAGDDEAGAQLVWDANRFKHEQLDFVAAAELLESRAEARQRLLDEDTGPDSMPDPDTDAMLLQAEGFRDFLAEENTYDAPSAERAAAIAQARAVLLSQRPEKFTQVANGQMTVIGNALREQGLDAAVVNHGHRLDAVDLGDWGTLSQTDPEDTDDPSRAGVWAVYDGQDVHYSHLDLSADPAEVATWAKSFQP